MIKSVREMWEECIGELCSHYSAEVRNFMITDMFICNELDYGDFNANYIFIQSNGVKVMTREDSKMYGITKSINNFWSFNHRAPAFPLWFYAGFPDVMTWYVSIQEGEICGDEAAGEVMAELFRTTVKEAEKISEDTLVDEREQFKPWVLNIIVNYYKTNINQGLELKSKDHRSLYKQEKIREDLGIDIDNFRFIARMIAMLYIELTSNYSLFLKDRKTVFWVVGVLDTVIVNIVVAFLKYASIYFVCFSLSMDSAKRLAPRCSFGPARSIFQDSLLLQFPISLFFY